MSIGCINARFCTFFLRNVNILFYQEVNFSVIESSRLLLVVSHVSVRNVCSLLQSLTIQKSWGARQEHYLFTELLPQLWLSPLQCAPRYLPTCPKIPDHKLLNFPYELYLFSAITQLQFLRERTRETNNLSYMYASHFQFFPKSIVLCAFPSHSATDIHFATSFRSCLWKVRFSGNPLNKCRNSPLYGSDCLSAVLHYLNKLSYLSKWSIRFFNTFASLLDSVLISVYIELFLN